LALFGGKKSEKSFDRAPTCGGKVEFEVCRLVDLILSAFDHAEDA
jgi:hypothetical protein